MKISYFENYDELSQASANILLGNLDRKNDLLLCAATGGSPLGFYELLTNEFKSNRSLFEHIRILKLDEWGGIPMTDPNSCESYLQKHLLVPLNISPDRYLAFDSSANNPEDECRRVQMEIDTIGPIDLCILGLGKNGHLGLNEPSNFLRKDCHVAKLSPSTMGHSMASAMTTKPGFGMTVGLRDIMKAKKILFLITGKQKEDSIQKLMKAEISTQLPASFLWLHPDVECLVDKTSL